MSDVANVQQELARRSESKRELETFLESSSWNLVVGIVQSQVDALQREVLFTPCTSVDSALGQEYKKGQVEGRLSISEVIQAEIEMCEVDIINARRKLNEYGDSDDSGSGNPGDGNHAP